jgi:hypothetical protein
MDRYTATMRAKHGTGAPFDRGEPSEVERERRDRENASRAERRARKAVRWGCLCIAADHLLTLTYRENVLDLDRVLRDWDQFRRLVNARYPGWTYIAVVEPQERGSLHIHAGVHGWQDVNYLRACWLRIVGEGMGNIDVQGPRSRGRAGGKSWSVDRLSGYLAKYISKTFASIPKGSKRYFASRNRPRPEVRRIAVQVRTMTEAVTWCFNVVAGGRAVGVTQWISPLGEVYWASSQDPPSLPF